MVILVQATFVKAAVALFSFGPKIFLQRKFFTKFFDQFFVCPQNLLDQKFLIKIILHLKNLLGPDFVLIKIVFDQYVIWIQIFLDTIFLFLIFWGLFFYHTFFGPQHLFWN